MYKARRGGRKRDIRELARINRSVGRVSTYLGAESEKSAQEICNKLKEEGMIKDFWHIPSHSILDRRGIDIICQADRGFFFLNVKKSLTGVRHFNAARERMKAAGRDLFIIYPWRVTSEVDGARYAKVELLDILSASLPSAEVLSPEIESELASPTYSVPPEPVKAEQNPKYYKKKVKRALRKYRGLIKVAATPIDVDGITNMTLAVLKNGNVILEVSVAAPIGEASEAAYKALFEKLKERNFIILF